LEVLTMSKKESAKRMGATLELLCRQMEFGESGPMRAEMQAAGLRYVRVTVQDVDTNESVSFHTWAADLVELQRHLQKFAPLPKALLDTPLVAEMFDPDLGQNVETHTTQGNLIKRQTLGGRKKRGGLSAKKAAEYQRLATRFYKSGLRKIEFSRETGVSLSTIGRALAHTAKKVSKNPP
jgi:hypothetical protein